MTISNDIVTFLGILLAFGGALVGVINWVINRHEKINEHIENKTEELQSKIESKVVDMNGTCQNRHNEYNGSISNIHKRIDNVKDTYVKRVDLDRDLINIMQILNSMEAAQRDQTKEMNARLDRLIAIFADKSSDKPN